MAALYRCGMQRSAHRTSCRKWPLMAESLGMGQAPVHEFYRPTMVAGVLVASLGDCPVEAMHTLPPAPAAGDLAAELQVVRSLHWV
jgi:hypothetical protein